MTMLSNIFKDIVASNIFKGIVAVALVIFFQRRLAQKRRIPVVASVIVLALAMVDPVTKLVETLVTRFSLLEKKKRPSWLRQRG